MRKTTEALSRNPLWIRARILTFGEGGMNENGNRRNPLWIRARILTNPGGYEEIRLRGESQSPMDQGKDSDL